MAMPEGHKLCNWYPKKYEGSPNSSTSGGDGGPFLHLTSMEWLSLCSAIFLVLIAESLNTAIEAAVDLTTDEQHPLAGIAKDCAAGAVLLAAIYSLVVAYLVFWPKISSIFFG
ncbi:hypothetical protein N752_16030 [Desulforamulus aquiferis]|nr:hypothetical protein N752_16030 [Desulforamulus aquiferis]